MKNIVRDARNASTRTSRPIPVLVHWASEAQRRRAAALAAHEAAQDAASALEAGVRVAGFTSLRVTDCSAPKPRKRAARKASSKPREIVLTDPVELTPDVPAPKKVRVRKPRSVKPVTEV